MSKYVEYVLPDSLEHDDSSKKDPLEIFIDNYQPVASEESELFRKNLCNMLEYICEHCAEGCRFLPEYKNVFE